MKALHRAALTRAYRTLAQGLGGSAVTTALVAIFVSGESAVKAALVTVATVIIGAATSFFQGIAEGLPEAPKPAAPPAEA
jgi:hypothetical protein